MLTTLQWKATHLIRLEQHKLALKNWKGIQSSAVGSGRVERLIWLNNTLKKTFKEQYLNTYYIFYFRKNISVLVGRMEQQEMGCGNWRRKVERDPRWQRPARTVPEGKRIWNSVIGEWSGSWSQNIDTEASWAQGDNPWPGTVWIQVTCGLFQGLRVANIPSPWTSHCQAPSSVKEAAHSSHCS